jgi:membrane protein DedA with SNARE-associated domain
MGKILYFVAFVCAVYVIHDVWFNNKRLSQPSKIIWTIAALFLSILTAVAYLILEKRR